MSEWRVILTKTIQLTLLSAFLIACHASPDAVRKSADGSDSVSEKPHQAVSKEVYDCIVRAHALANGDIEPPSGLSPEEASANVLKQCEQLEPHVTFFHVL